VPKKRRWRPALSLRYALYCNPSTPDPLKELFDWLGNHFLPYESLAESLGAQNNDLSLLIRNIGRNPQDHGLWRRLIDRVGVEQLIYHFNQVIKI
jgi:hypothetical protein